MGLFSRLLAPSVVAFSVSAAVPAFVTSNADVWPLLLAPIVSMLCGIAASNYLFPLLPQVKRVDTRDKRLRQAAEQYADRMNIDCPRVYVFPNVFDVGGFTTGTTFGRSVVFIRKSVYVNNPRSTLAHEMEHLRQPNYHHYVLAAMMPLSVGSSYVMYQLVAAVLPTLAALFLSGATAVLLVFAMFALFARIRRQQELDAYATMVAIDGPHSVLRLYGGPKNRDGVGLFGQYPSRTRLQEYISDPENVKWT